jgi:hypothetical protein
MPSRPQSNALPAASPSQPSANGDAAPVLPGPFDYAVLISQDDELFPAGPGAPSGAFEAQLVHQLGFAPTQIYEKQGECHTAVLFDTKEGANAALAELKSAERNRWSTALLVTIKSWCPESHISTVITVQSHPVPVFRCGEKASSQIGSSQRDLSPGLNSSPAPTDGRVVQTAPPRKPPQR